MKNGGEKSGTRERAQVGASDLQASPLSEGDRRLWGVYIKRQRVVQENADWRWGRCVVGRTWGEKQREDRDGMRRGSKHPSSPNSKGFTVYLENPAISNVELTGAQLSVPHNAAGERPTAPRRLHGATEHQWGGFKGRPPAAASRRGIPRVPMQPADGLPDGRRPRDATWSG